MPARRRRAIDGSPINVTLTLQGGLIGRAVRRWRAGLTP